jgi:hypothetical protein
MWGKRKKRGSRLERQLALARLEDAMGRVQRQLQQEEEGELEAIQYPGVPAPSLPPEQSGASGLRDADVPVDNSAGPVPSPAGSEGKPENPPPGQLPVQRSKGGSRHGSFG